MRLLQANTQVATSSTAQASAIERTLPRVEWKWRCAGREGRQVLTATQPQSAMCVSCPGGSGSNFNSSSNTQRNRIHTHVVPSSTTTSISIDGEEYTRSSERNVKCCTDRSLQVETTTSLSWWWLVLLRGERCFSWSISKTRGLRTVGNQQSHASSCSQDNSTVARVVHTST